MNTRNAARLMSILPQEADDFLADVWIFDLNDTPRGIFEKALDVLNAWHDAKGDHSQVNSTGWNSYQIDFLACLPNSLPKGDV